MPPQLPLSNGLTLQRRREEPPTTHQHPKLVAKLPGMNCRLPHHVEGVPSVGMNLSDRDCRPLHATGTEPRIPSAFLSLREPINTKPATFSQDTVPH